MSSDDKIIYVPRIQDYFNIMYFQIGREEPKKKELYYTDSIKDRFKAVDLYTTEKLPSSTAVIRVFQLFDSGRPDTI